MKSFFTIEPKKKAISTLAQLRAALEKASAHSLSVVSERWSAISSSFALRIRKGQTQSMNGGCGGLWMELHGHTAAYGVAAFNNKGVWDRVGPCDQQRRHQAERQRTSRCAREISGITDQAVATEVGGGRTRTSRFSRCIDHQC